MKIQFFIKSSINKNKKMRQNAAFYKIVKILFFIQIFELDHTFSVF